LFRKRYLLDIQKVQLNRRRASEDCHRNLERGLLLVNVFYLAGETLERTRFDAHRLSRSIRKLRLRFFGRLGHVMHDLIDFLRRERRWSLSTDKTSYFWCRTNGMKDVVGDMAPVVAFDLHQYIAGIEHASRLDALVSAHFDYGFRRHEHFADCILQICSRDPSLQAFTNLFLVSGIRMKDEPLLH